MEDKPPEKLLPCPFCGPTEEHPPEILNEYWSHDRTVWLIKCGCCEMKTQDYTAREYVVEAWNTRALASQVAPPADAPSADAKEEDERLKEIRERRANNYTGLNSAGASGLADIDYLLTRLSQVAAEKDVCWHCGVVLTYTPKPRCEDCPDECDEEGCDEMGCEAARTDDIKEKQDAEV